MIIPSGSLNKTLQSLDATMLFSVEVEVQVCTRVKLDEQDLTKKWKERVLELDHTHPFP